MYRLSPLFIAALLLAGCASTERPEFEGPGVTAAEPVQVSNQRCPITGEAALSEQAFEFEGYVIRACSAGCAALFQAAPKEHALPLMQETGILVVSLEAREPAAEDDAPPAGPGPVEVGNVTCPVMTDALAEPHIGVEHNGYWVSFCCETCIDDFRTAPDKYREAILDDSGIDIRKPATP